MTDFSGNRNDKIADAVKVIGRSKQRLKVFLSIYSGKKIKTVNEISIISGMSTMRVSQEAQKLASEDMVIQTKKDGKTAYEKINFYTKNKNKIASLVNDSDKLAKYPTKLNPQPLNSCKSEN